MDRLSLSSDMVAVADIDDRLRSDISIIDDTQYLGCGCVICRCIGRE